MLTWLLASETVQSLPLSAEPTSTVEFRTQYPPTTQEARLRVPEARAFYPTSLEREGRSAEQPFPTDLNLGHLLDPLLHPQGGSEPGVLDLLLSGLQPPTQPVPTKHLTTNPSVVTSSSPSKASTSKDTLPLISSPPVVSTASSSSTTANEESTSQNTGSARPDYSSPDGTLSSSLEPAGKTSSSVESQTTSSATSGDPAQQNQSSTKPVTGKLSIHNTTH
ncbi:endo-1,3-beta glucanase [Aspergillus fumigatus]